ncbi:MAG: hypothetical protein WCL51_00075 [Bacteroidota bacterium]
MKTQNQFDSEYYYFIINYLIGEKIQMHSNFGFYMHVVKNINKLSKYELVDYLENYMIQSTLHTPCDLKDFFATKDMYSRTNKLVTKILKHGKMPKIDFEIVKSFNDLIATNKSELLRICNELLEKQHLLPYVDLLDNDILKTSFSLYNRDVTIKEKEIGEIIYNNFKRKDRLLVLGSMIGMQMDLFLVEDGIGTSKNEEDLVTVGSSCLLTIPCSKKLTKDNLIFIRKQFHAKFDSLFAKIYDFRSKFLKKELDDDLMIEFNNFTSEIENELEILQLEIDNHIYFQKIKNSDPDYVNISINLGVLPIDLIFMVYVTSNVISFDKYLELSIREYNEIGKGMGDIYLYYEIEPKINEEENTEE